MELHEAQAWREPGQDDSGFLRRGKDKKWSIYKMKNHHLANAYDVIDAHTAERLRLCSSRLVFGIRFDGIRKLISGMFCRVRLCPICQWRRSLKLYSQVLQVLHAMQDQEYRFIFLTFTVRNVSGEELSQSISDMLYSFNKVTKYKEFKRAVYGWYRGMEVTHNVDVSSNSYDTFHPHIHCLLAVKRSYFTSRDYISQEKFTELWKRALGVSYTPIVHVERVRPKNKNDGASGIVKAVCEATKYAAKSSDYIIFDDWNLTVETVRILDKALAGRQLIGFGGCMREMRKKLKLDSIESGDLINIDGSDSREEEYDYFASYAWHTGYLQYVGEDCY